jgi:hypothetical protein
LSKCYESHQVKPKKVKEVWHKRRKCGLVWAAPNIQVPPTVQSANCTTEVAALGLGQALSAIIHRTIRTERRTIMCDGQPTTISHVSRLQRSNGSPDSLVPQKRKTANQRSGDCCIVHCPVCHQTVWCTRRQGRLGAFKWSSNDF